MVLANDSNSIALVRVDLLTYTCIYWYMYLYMYMYMYLYVCKLGPFVEDVVNVVDATHTHTHTGVFFITKQNGNVDVWDLLDRSHEPSLAQNISTMSITSIQSWQLTGGA